MHRVEDFLSAYPKDCNRHLTETAYIDLLMTGKIAEDELVQCAANYAESCKILETPERYIKNAENFLKEFVFEKYLPKNYKKPTQQRSKSNCFNNFNNFPQRDYSSSDMNTMERQLLGK